MINDLIYVKRYVEAQEAADKVKKKVDPTDGTKKSSDIEAGKEEWQKHVDEQIRKKVNEDQGKGKEIDIKV